MTLYSGASAFNLYRLIAYKLHVNCIRSYNKTQRAPAMLMTAVGRFVSVSVFALPRTLLCCPKTDRNINDEKIQNYSFDN